MRRGLSSPVGTNGREQERLRRIGKATEDALNFTQSFLSSKPHPPPTVHPSVQLCIRNSPDDVLLSVQGANMYWRVARVLRWSLRAWYGLRYCELAVSVVPIAPGAAEGSGGDGLRLKWRIEGERRTNWLFRLLFGSFADQRGRLVLLSGYSVYEFHSLVGDVKYHLIDRIVPPTVKGGWLWWYLDRIAVSATVAGGQAKPLVGSSSTNGSERL